MGTSCFFFFFFFFFLFFFFVVVFQLCEHLAKGEGDGCEHLPKERAGCFLAL